MNNLIPILNAFAGPFNIQKLMFSVMSIFLVSGGLQAQETILTTGGHSSGIGGTVSYSIGQVVYTTHKGTSGSVSQGVQQLYAISTVTGIDVKTVELELSVYPNPTTNFLTLLVDVDKISTFSFQLYDNQGNLLEDRNLTENINSIKMANMPMSTYFLVVTDNKSIVKTFKIIKN